MLGLWTGTSDRIRQNSGELTSRWGTCVQYPASPPHSSQRSTALRETAERHSRAACHQSPARVQLHSGSATYRDGGGWGRPWLVGTAAGGTAQASHRPRPDSSSRGTGASVRDPRDVVPRSYVPGAFALPETGTCPSHPPAFS